MARRPASDGGSAWCFRVVAPPLECPGRAAVSRGFEACGNERLSRGDPAVGLPSGPRERQRPARI